MITNYDRALRICELRSMAELLVQLLGDIQNRYDPRYNPIFPEHSMATALVSIANLNTLAENFIQEILTSVNVKNGKE